MNVMAAVSVNDRWRQCWRSMEQWYIRFGGSSMPHNRSKRCMSGEYETRSQRGEGRATSPWSAQEQQRWRSMSFCCRFWEMGKDIGVTSMKRCSTMASSSKMWRIPWLRWWEETCSSKTKMLLRGQCILMERLERDLEGRGVAIHGEGNGRRRGGGCCFFFVERKEGELELQPWGKERRRGAQLMEEEEEMGCSFSGACVRERGGDEGGIL